MDEVTIIDGKIFKCEQCGECCRHLDIIPSMASYDIGNGVCRYLLNIINVLIFAGVNIYITYAMKA